MVPLVGRVAQLRQIAALVEAVRDGRTQVLLITGPEGVGKSRLAGTIATQMPTYTHLLRESEQGVAFGAIDRLIDEQLPETASELAALRVRSGVPTFAIGVVNLIERLPGPFAVVVDDLQYLDEPSQEAFWHVIRRLDNVPALFVATSTTTQGWFAERVVQHITVGRRGRHIALEPFDEDEVQTFVRSTLFAPLDTRQVKAVMRATGGSPGLLVDLVERLRSPDSTTLDAALAQVSRRHEALTEPQAQRLFTELSVPDAAGLLTIALGGPLSSRDFAAAVDSLGSGPVQLPTLRATGLVHEPSLSLLHPALASTLTAAAPQSLVHAVHAALGSVLTGVEGLKHRAFAWGGSPDTNLADDLVAGARAAAGVGDVELATQLMAWACDLDVSHLPMACLFALRARRPALIQSLEPRVGSLPPGLTRSLLHCALDAMSAGVQSLRLPDALPLPHLDDTLLLLLAHSLAALGRSRSSQGLFDMPPSMGAVRDELRRRAGRADAAPADPDRSADLVNLDGLLTMWLLLGEARTSLEATLRAMEAHAQRLAAHPAAAAAHAVTLSIAASLNTSTLRYGRAHLQVEQLSRVASIHPDIELSTALVKHRLLFHAGDWDAAQASIERGLAVTLDDLRDVGALQAQATAALIPWCRGDEDLGSRMLTHVSTLAANRRFSSAMGAVLWARGWAAAADGDPRAVVDSFGPLWLSPLTGGFAGAGSAVLRVRAHVALGDVPAARAARAQLLSIDVPSEALAFLLHHIDALLAVGAEDHDTAARLFLKAHAALKHRRHTDTPQSLQMITALLVEDWGRFLVDTGARQGAEDCADELSVVIALLLRAGAGRWRERLEHLHTGLSASVDGARNAALPAHGDLLGRLTRREREIVELILRGRTNRDIAGELFLSVRTVEFHVRNALAKTGDTTRGELRDRLRTTTGS